MSQPWLTEAVGTAEWAGTALGPLLDEAGPAPGAIEVLFTGLDRGVEGGVPQWYERSLPIAEAELGLLAYEMNGAPLPPQHGFPLRLVVPGWYGMQNVKWLTRITVLEEPFTGFQNAVGYRMYDADGVAGEPVTRMQPRSLMVPPGVPGVHDPRAPPRARAGDADRAGVVGPGADRARGGVHRRRRHVRRRRARRAARPARLARLALRLGRARGRAHRCAAAPPTPPATRSRSSRPGT